LRLVGAITDITELKQKEKQLRESPDHQTTAADALRLISRSSFDLQTVLDSLVESATRLCEADHSWLFQREGNHFSWSAGFGNATDVHERIRDFHILDVLQDSEYTYGEAQKIGGYRSVLGVPLRASALREGMREIIEDVRHGRWRRPHSAPKKAANDHFSFTSWVATGICDDVLDALALPS
jgi:hypothetical protein